jgi:hypothetical protein
MLGAGHDDWHWRGSQPGLLDVEVGHTTQYLLKHAPKFEANDSEGDAAVGAQAEGHVVLIGAVEIHLFGVLELGPAVIETGRPLALVLGIGEPWTSCIASSSVTDWWSAAIRCRLHLGVPRTSFVLHPSVLSFFRAKFALLIPSTLSYTAHLKCNHV